MTRKRARTKLNLDELYGVDAPIEVEWQGKTYEMRQLQALSPQEFAAFSRLQKRAQALSGVDASLTEEQAQELDAVSRETMRILCPDLADLPFMLLARVLRYYGEQVNADFAESEKKA